MLREQETKRTEELIACSREIAAKFARDPQRPQFHFLPPAAWMNDINGCIFWKGRYHIFYQYNPDEAYWRQMHWGHASSVDLVHWVHHPIALFPEPDGPARDGCFSGGAFLLDGKPALFYHGVPDGTCIATSDDDLLIYWTPCPSNPVIRAPQPEDPEYGKYCVFDPCAWREGDGYAALIANRVPGIEGDCTSLFRSGDGIRWKYIGPFYTSDRRWTDALEDCAVADFFPLGNKHMLLFTSHLVGSQYYIGRYECDHFYPDVHGRTSTFCGQLGGGRTLLDGLGKRIYFDWIWDLRGDGLEGVERASGWSGVMTLPRVFSLREDGTLGIEVAPEIEKLRMDGCSRKDILLCPGVEVDLPEMNGDCLELGLTVELKSRAGFGLKVRCSPDGAEETVVLYDPELKSIRVDVANSSLNKNIHYQHYRTSPTMVAKAFGLPVTEDLPKNFPQTVQELPLELAPGESLEMRIFLDRSVIEVFANGRQCITQRIYPTLEESKGIRVFSIKDDARIRRIDAWPIGPTH